VAQSVNSRDRFNNPSRKCPICSGWERGNPQCKGYLGEKPGVVFCTSSDYAGILVRGDTGAFRHWTGPQGCKCGVSHLPAFHNNNNNTNNNTKPKAEPMINHDGSRPKTVEETYPYGGGCFVDRVLTGYTKEDGKPEKTFQQYQVIDGKKVYQGFKKLYRLDEVKASGKGFYFLVEGERKVNKLWEMGFPATCNVGGSGSWADSYADELPQGATAYIWPDNDDAGLKWIDKIITSLSTRKIKWHVLNGLTVGLPNKGDVMDWVKIPGNDAARLQAELDKYAPAKMLWSLTELEKFPKPQWLVGGVIKKNSIAVLVGPPKCGKSFYSLMLALMIASTGGKVVYIGAEDPGGFYQRGMAWCERNRVDPKILEGHLFFWVKPVALHDDAERDAFISMVKEHFAPDLIVVDTLAMNSFGLNENESKDMNLYVRAVLELRDATNACIYTVHHTNRAGEYRGSSVLPGASDTFMMAAQVGDPLHKGGTLKITCSLQRSAKPFEDKFFVAVAVMETLVLIPAEEQGGFEVGTLNETAKELLQILAGPEGAGGLSVPQLIKLAGWKKEDESKRTGAYRMMRDLAMSNYANVDRQGRNSFYSITQKGRDIIEQGDFSFDTDQEF
jgi:archaellum biogenesis ATPase FlaH